MLQVEEVLDPAVPIAKYHYRLQLLGNDGLAWVGEHSGVREVEQCRIGSGSRRRPDHITDANIEPQRQTRWAAARREGDALPGVLVFGANRGKPNVLTINVHGIRRHRGRGDCADILSDRLVRAVAPPQEVEIKGGAVGSLRSQPHDHRSFEHEPVAVGRD